VASDRRGRGLTVLAGLAAVFALSAQAAMAAPPITGRWITEGDKSVIEIGPCGPKICGHVAKVLKYDNPPLTQDSHNPDPALRNRPIVGLQLLTGFTDAGKEWRGQIYDPESGHTYRSTAQVQPDGRLKVAGCFTFICLTQTWRHTD
jgi:uncharacterized protein (DUF2147 family)